MREVSIPDIGGRLRDTRLPESAILEGLGSATITGAVGAAIYPISEPAGYAFFAAILPVLVATTVSARQRRGPVRSLPKPPSGNRPCREVREAGKWVEFRNRNSADAYLRELIDYSMSRENQVVEWMGVACELLFGKDGRDLPYAGQRMKEALRKGKLKRIRGLDLDPTGSASASWAALESRPDVTPQVILWNERAFYQEIACGYEDRVELRRYKSTARRFVLITNDFVLVQHYVHGQAHSDDERPCVGDKGPLEVWLPTSEYAARLRDEVRRQWRGARPAPNPFEP